MTTGIASETTVFNAIVSRRSNGKCSDAIPPVEWIERILEAGTWAPNHHLTEPWRFFVLMGEARNRLGDALADAARAAAETPESGEKAADAQRTKPLRAPVIIALAVEPGEKAIELEEIASVAAAGQNMLLTAHELGLAAIWRSGKIAYSPQVREFFGLSDRATFLGFIYVGYPSNDAPPRSRRPHATVTTWLN
jgi:nitroreductase